jgi:nitrile hydratase
MNGIHDLGGMHGFGPVRAEAGEPPFHETWEGRAAGILEVMTFPPGFTVDRFRYLRETLRPDRYLTQTYYEQWIYIAEQTLLESGMVTRRHGGHVLPDSSAHGLGDAPQHLYTVAFTARALWGEAANARDKVHLDLWESCLEPA